MKNITCAFMALGLLIVGGTMGSCSEDEHALLDPAQVVIPLTAQGQDGTVYRLEADFAIWGNLYSASLDDNNERLSVQVPSGSWVDVRLLDGWTLYRQQYPNWEPVEAVLQSPNPVSLTLQYAQSAVITFVFAVGQDNLELAGAPGEPEVGIEIDVDEVMGGLGLCPKDKYCVAGNGVFSMSTPSQFEQEQWVPFAISFDFFEWRPISDFATGTMTLHFAPENIPGLSSEQRKFLRDLEGEYDLASWCRTYSPGSWEFGAHRMINGNAQDWVISADFPAVSDENGYPMLVTSSGQLRDGSFSSNISGWMQRGSQEFKYKSAFFVEP
jgi:hypothetical protein